MSPANALLPHQVNHTLGALLAHGKSHLRSIRSIYHTDLKVLVQLVAGFVLSIYPYDRRGGTMLPIYLTEEELIGI
jgi:hypothetical protein